MVNPLFGFLLSAILALLAQRAGALSRSGAAAAVVVGAAALTAGWSWALLLALFFLTSSALSRLPHFGPEAVSENTGPRDLSQVLANGGLLTLSAIGSLLHPSGFWFVAAAGALSAATADTWATEIGSRLGGPPVHLLTRRPVASGTSGGVTRAGSVAAASGALLLSLASFAVMHSLSAAVAAAAAGLAGSFADSLLGATIQERRWCALCAIETEQRVHACGNVTVHRAGLPHLTNDAVNLCCTAVGATCALIVSWFLGAFPIS